MAFQIHTAEQQPRHALKPFTGLAVYTMCKSIGKKMALWFCDLLKNPLGFLKNPYSNHLSRHRSSNEAAATSQFGNTTPCSLISLQNCRSKQDVIYAFADMKVKVSSILIEPSNELPRYQNVIKNAKIEFTLSTAVNSNFGNGNQTNQRFPFNPTVNSEGNCIITHVFLHK